MVHGAAGTQACEMRGLQIYRNKESGGWEGVGISFGGLQNYGFTESVRFLEKIEK
jgi:hypothetical protein